MNATLVTELMKIIQNGVEHIMSLPPVIMNAELAIELMK